MEQTIWNRLINAGMTSAGAAGMMGNLYAESALKPDNLENLCEKRLREAGKPYCTDELYTQAVDNGTIDRAEFMNPLPGKQYGYGLAQWTSPGRKAGLYDLVKERGVSIADAETQVDYLLQELQNTYQTVWNTLTVTTSVKEASDVVLVRFESPANTGTSVKNIRAKYAQKYYDQYANKEVTPMISNCGHDENGRYTGGAAGDQTGGEWEIRSWYNRPWDYVLRHPDENVREMIASMAEAAARNDLIGYDQNDRYTFWEHLKASNYDPAQITVKCEADCSSGVAAIVKGAGYRLNNAALKGVSIYCYTGNLRSALKAAGFTVLSASKYLTSASYLLRGDILLYEGHHVATNLTTGSQAGSGSDTGSSGSLNETVKWNGTVTTTLNVRKWAGTGNALCSFSPLATGTVVGVCDTVQAANGTAWYYILHNGKYGFVSADYIRKESEQTVENEVIAAGQIHVNNFCNAGIAVDGIRGDDTKKAGIKAVQHAMNLDYGSGIKETGEWTYDCTEALKGHYVKKGETQHMVTALEILFMLRGIECGGVESPGVFGDGLYDAVYAYKKEKKWDPVNGSAGKGTFLSLMGVSA